MLRKNKLKNKTKNQMNPGGGDSPDQLCDPTKAQLYYYYPDLDGYYPNPYEQYDEEEEEEEKEVDEAMDVNADVMTTIQPEQQQQPDEMQLTGEVTVEADQLASVDATVQNAAVLVLKQKTTTTEDETRELNGDPACASVASTNGGTGRRKKRRKKRNKTTTLTTADDEEALDRTELLQLPQASQPLARVRHSPLSLGSPSNPPSLSQSLSLSLSLSLSRIESARYTHALFL